MNKELLKKVEHVFKDSTYCGWGVLLEELKQALTPSTADSIYQRLNSNEKLLKKFQTDWRFNKYVEYCLSKDMNWNELMEYMAFDLFDKHFMAMEEK